MKLIQLFSYFGPNRRSDATLTEARFSHEEGEAETIASGWTDAMLAIRRELSGLGPEESAARDLLDIEMVNPLECFLNLFNGIALILQQVCGHVVSDNGYLDGGRRRLFAWFEQDEAAAGRQSAVMSLALLDQAFPALSLEFDGFREEKSFAELLPLYRAKVEALAQPGDTAAIISAARRQGVPVIRLERDPYTPVEGDFRLRMNSMLMLGHATHRQTIDGTFALERSESAYDLLFDRRKVMQAAEELGMPVPPAYRHRQPLLSVARAGRAGRELGFPLMLHPLQRREPGARAYLAGDASELESAAGSFITANREFVIESHVSGQPFKLLLAGHHVVAALNADDLTEVEGEVHESTRNMAVAASITLNVGMLLITLVAEDLAVDLERQGGAIIDLEMAPRLDELFAPDSILMTEAAERFVRWLVPNGAAARIPVVSVTGTNGKTTTSRMLAHIFQHSGLVTGLQCTDGRYVNGVQIFEGDDSALTGHFCFYENRDIELAVLETHHRGIATTGFAFRNCDVAVCTNVSDDHMQEFGIDSVAEMGVLKRSLIERASKVAVLNADDPLCLAMIPFVQAERTCLFSTGKNAAELAGEFKAGVYCCTLEKINAKECIVMREGDSATTIIPVAEIPATFGGLARFNIQNAMAATAAAYSMGVEAETIRSALYRFVMSKENTPDRLNFFTGLPFQVLVDFAHNPEGLSRLAEFTDSLDISGERTLLFSGTRSVEHTRRMAKAVSGRYDRYVLFHREPGRATHADTKEASKPSVIETVLLDNGVSSSQIEILPSEIEAVEHALNRAAAGGLVVLLPRSSARKQIGDILQDHLQRGVPAG